MILGSKFLRPILLTIHQQVTQRIFDEGRDAKGQPIGVYSQAYIKRRQRKGLGSSPKVVLEFTGQMRNDFSLVEEGEAIGSGFKNPFNADKAGWVEGTYNKEIFNLTLGEVVELERLLDQQAQIVLNRQAEQKLNG